MATIAKKFNRAGQHIGWQASVRMRGWKPQYRTFAKKVEAEAWAADVETQQRKRVFIDTRAAERMTLGDALARYATDYVPKLKGEHREANRAAQIGRADIAALSLINLTPQALAEYRDARLQQVTSGTVKLEMATIRRVLNLAIKEWGLSGIENPMRRVEIPRAGKARDRRLVGDEWDRLLAAANTDSCDYLLPSLLLLVETGMRVGELLSLEWANVDFDLAVASLDETKNGDVRDVPLSGDALITLRCLEHRPPRQKHLRSRVLPCGYNTLQKAFVRVCKQAGIADLRIHDLRHEATSRFFERGLSQAQVQRVTGHKTLAMLSRYTHLRAADIAAQMRDW